MNVTLWRTKMDTMYRIISLPSFFNLITHKTERYVHPYTWEDTYEGYLLSFLGKNQNDTKQILEKLMNTFSINNLPTTVENYFRLWSARWLCYGQCWTTREESDALWRIYSYDKMAIRIETDEQKIQELIQNSDPHKQYLLQIKDIAYDLDTNGHLKTSEELIIEMEANKNSFEPFFHKRCYFEHEHEKRVLLLDQSRYLGFTSMLSQASIVNYCKKYGDGDLSSYSVLQGLSKEIHSLLPSRIKENIPRSVEIYIPCLPDYIKSVMVHPQAEDWIVKLIESTCSKEKIDFLGKSRMYERIS